jgi:hypothetical protein
MKVNELGLLALTITVVVFGTSAAAKLRDRAAYRSYRAGLREAGLVASRLLPATAAALASYEALVAVGSAGAVVLTAASLPGAVLASWSALAAAFALTSVLTAGVGVAIRRGTQASCACFGSASPRPLGAAQLARNITMLTVMAAGLIGQGLGHGMQAPAEAALGVAAGAIIGLMLIRLDDLIVLFSPVSASQVRSVRPASREGNAR